MKLIEKRYGIKYSYKQVWEIATIKLGLNYHKPFLIYQQSPDDAEDQLKKTRKYRIMKNGDIVVSDESRCQNTPNTSNTSL